MTKQKSLIWLMLACVVGYLCILIFAGSTLDGVTVCVFKNLYGIPCPACGTTHGLIALTYGDFTSALKYNPNSYLLAFIMIFIPACTVYDILSGKRVLYLSYKKLSGLLKKPLFLVIFFIAEASIWGYKLAGHFGWF